MTEEPRVKSNSVCSFSTRHWPGEFFVRNPTRRRMRDSFPWLSHRTLAEVDLIESIRLNASNRPLYPYELRQLREMRR